MKRNPLPPQLGSVSASEVMPLREFGRRMGLASRALADVQRKGLRAVTFGRTKYILGSDALAWFAVLAEQQHGFPDSESKCQSANRARESEPTPSL